MKRRFSFEEDKQCLDLNIFEEDKESVTEATDEEKRQAVIENICDIFSSEVEQLESDTENNDILGYFSDIHTEKLQIVENYLKKPMTKNPYYLQRLNAIVTDLGYMLSCYRSYTYTKYVSDKEKILDIIKQKGKSKEEQSYMLRIMANSDIFPFYTSYADIDKIDEALKERIIATLETYRKVLKRYVMLTSKYTLVSINRLVMMEKQLISDLEFILNGNNITIEDLSVYGKPKMEILNTYLTELNNNVPISERKSILLSMKHLNEVLPPSRRFADNEMMRYLKEDMDMNLVVFMKYISDYKDITLYYDNYKNILKSTQVTTMKSVGLCREEK